MIEFIGMPSGELKKYIINYNKKIGLIGGIPGALIMLAVIIYYALKVHLVVLFGLVGPALWIFLIVSQPFKKDVPKLCSTKLTILLKKGIMITHTHEQAYTRSISAVKRVLDVGNGYVFSFQYKDRNPYFHCQKDLISEGTIEQFEELFKDKIVRLSQVAS